MHTSMLRVNIRTILCVIMIISVASANDNYTDSQQMLSQLKNVIIPQNFSQILYSNENENKRNSFMNATDHGNIFHQLIKGIDTSRKPAVKQKKTTAEKLSIFTHKFDRNSTVSREYLNFQGRLNRILSNRKGSSNVSKMIKKDSQLPLQNAKLNTSGSDHKRPSLDALNPPSNERITIAKAHKWVGRRQSGSKRNEDPSDNFYVSSDREEVVGERNGETSFRTESNRHKKSSIRHRKSRKTFTRARKSPKMRQRSHSYDYDYHKVPFKNNGKNIIEQDENLYEIADVSVPEGHQKPLNSFYEDLAITSQRLVLDEVTSAADNVHNDTLQEFTMEDQYVDSTLGEIYDDHDSSFESSNLSNDDSVDVVTKFLRKIESQQSMGENCTKGTELKLNEGVVDRYAQERFRLEAEVAVNRANLYTRLWKYSRKLVLSSPYLLHAEVLSLVEFDEDIFAAGNCYDRFQYKGYELYCPFAHRMPGGKIRVKDLALQYFYLTNGSEWFLDAKRSAERVIEDFTQIRKSKHS